MFAKLYKVVGQESVQIFLSCKSLFYSKISTHYVLCSEKNREWSEETTQRKYYENKEITYNYDFVALHLPDYPV